MCIRDSCELLVQRNEFLILVSRAQIAGITGHRPFEVRPLVATRVGSERAVTTITCPTHRQGNRGAVIAKLVGICYVRRWQSGAGNDIGILQASSKIDRISFGKWHAKAQSTARGHKLVVTWVLVRAAGPVIQVNR